MLSFDNRVYFLFCGLVYSLAGELKPSSVILLCYGHTSVALVF